MVCSSGAERRLITLAASEEDEMETAAETESCAGDAKIFSGKDSPGVTGLDVEESSVEIVFLDVFFLFRACR